MASSRFPGKPLLDLLGMPMIEHVWHRTKMCEHLDEVYIATCDTEIQQASESFGAKVIMTKDTHEMCMDRVVEAASKVKVDIVVTVQGDEPLINPKDIKKVIKNCLKTKNRNSIYNGMCKVTNYKDAYKSQLPKVVFNNKKELLYMSRAPIPNNKKLNNENFYKQVCIYSIPKKLLEIFGKRKKTYFENIEDIEIIRFLELGFVVKMIELSDTISVDFPSDIKKVERILQKNKNLYA